MTPLDRMAPRIAKLTERQRLGLFVAIILALLILVLHNPTQGYVTELWVKCELPKCLCANGPLHLGFLEWRSSGAMIDSLSTLGAAALAFAALAVALVAWLYLLAPSRGNRAVSQENPPK